ncbi:MAG: DUF4293 domain-containing protein [Paludibacteraceae bacterium]|nr:DUF4293 domain-containing protein [Paludibacteraceae bacterium]
MLQRIQTVYLAITFVLSLLLFFIPFAGFDLLGVTSKAGEVLSESYSFTVVGLHKSLVGSDAAAATSTSVYAYSISLMILEIVILLVNIIGIGLYKKRIFQMRFNTLNILLNLGFYPLFFLFAWTVSERIASDLGVTVSISYYFPIVFPVVNMLLTYLAIRAIGKDEALIRSLDRIR